MQGQIGVTRGRSGDDGDKMPVLVDNKMSDRQPMLLLKQVNVTTETVGVQSTVDAVCERCARNTMLQASKAGTRCARQAKPQFRERVLRDPQMTVPEFFFLVVSRKILAYGHLWVSDLPNSTPQCSCVKLCASFFFIIAKALRLSGRNAKLTKQCTSWVQKKCFFFNSQDFCCVRTKITDKIIALLGKVSLSTKVAPLLHPNLPGCLTG